MRVRLLATVTALGAAVLAGCARTGDPVTRAGLASTAGSAELEAATTPSATASTSAVVPGRRPAPPPTPCAANRRPQWIYVDLARQHMWMCERHRAVRDTAVTTGMRGPDTETPTGSYRIEGLNRNSVLTLSNGDTYPVKYWIPFDAPLFGFHDSSWQDFPYGGPQYRTAGSHGCVHVPLAAIRFLYRWADIGTRVTIRG